MTDERRSPTPHSSPSAAVQDDFVRRLVAALLPTVALAALTPEPAQARGDIPVLTQVTNNTTGDVLNPKIRSQEASRIVFVSTGNVMGPGTATGHSEIYLHEVESGLTSRVTNTPPAVVGADNLGSWAAARPTDQVFNAGRPEFVTFVSRGDFDSTRDNSDGNPEIFLWEVLTNKFHQLTDTPAHVINQQPYASDSGRCIVFSSTADLDNNDGSDPGNPGTGHSNPDGSMEVFLYSVDASDGFPHVGSFTQVSDGPAGTSSTQPIVGGYWFPRQCQTTGFVSNYDQTGGLLTGNNHIYVYDRNSGLTDVMSAPKEIPWGIVDGDYINPNISGASPFARGPFIVFQTNADLWRNGSDNWELFRYRVFHPRMTQYTDIGQGNVERPVVSDGGGYLVFQSNGEILHPSHQAKNGQQPPFNDDGNYEIFRTKGRRKVWQLTDTQNCSNTLPSVRDDGTSITFRSTCDLIPGRNPNGVAQIFLFREVKGDDPLATAAGCLVSQGCCNEANGCYSPLQGRKPKTRKKDCIERPRSGCNPPLS